MNTRGAITRTAAIALAVGMLLAAGAGAEEQETRSFPFTPGATLDLESLMGGHLEAEGWDRDEIEITYWDRYGEPEDFDIEFRETRSGGLKVETEWARGRSRDRNSLRYEIRLPRECKIEFRSGGGGIELTGLKGEFEARTAGGSIVLHDLEGEVKISSGGGEIEIKDSNLDGRVTTGGGEVLVENVVGDVRASSGGGNVQYKNVRDREGNLRGPRGGTFSRDFDSAEVVLISSAGGEIRLKEAPEGADVSTGGGDVVIKRARKFVKARTGGGNVDVRIAGGPVEASTGAGDVEVVIGTEDWEVDGPIVLNTGYGDVTLVVPEDFSMDLDLSIGYTRNSKQDFRIISDVEFEEERSDEWDTRHGTPRRYILGTGKVKGGSHRVEIMTINGNIRIKVVDR